LFDRYQTPLYQHRFSGPTSGTGITPGRSFVPAGGAWQSAGLGWLMSNWALWPIFGLGPPGGVASLGLPVSLEGLLVVLLGVVCPGTRAARTLVAKMASTARARKSLGLAAIRTGSKGKFELELGVDIERASALSAAHLGPVVGGSREGMRVQQITGSLSGTDWVQTGYRLRAMIAHNPLVDQDW